MITNNTSTTSMARSTLMILGHTSSPFTVHSRPPVVCTGMGIISSRAVVVMGVFVVLGIVAVDGGSRRGPSSCSCVVVIIVRRVHGRIIVIIAAPARPYAVVVWTRLRVRTCAQWAIFFFKMFLRCLMVGVNVCSVATIRVTASATFRWLGHHAWCSTSWMGFLTHLKKMNS